MTDADPLSDVQRDLIREMSEAWAYLCLAYTLNQFERKKMTWRGYHYAEDDPKGFDTEDRTGFGLRRAAGLVLVRYGSATRW